MEIKDIDLKSVLISIKHYQLSKGLVSIDYHVGMLEVELRNGKIYDDELVLLRILHNRVELRKGSLRGEIKKLQDKRYNSRTTLKSATFKDIDISKVERFIKENEFTKPTYGSIECEIGEQYFRKFLK